MKITISCLIILLSAISFSQSSVTEKMLSTAPNFTSFSTTQKVEFKDLERFSSKTDHPEYGTLPFNAPCNDCFEVLEERTQYSRKFLTAGKDGKEFLTQKGYSPLHYKNNSGQWITYNPKLTKINSSLFRTSNPYYEVSINTSIGFVSFENFNEKFEKLVFHNELSLELLNDNQNISNSIPANWSNFIAGESGVKVIDVFPGVDLEILLFRDVVKTNFIINNDLGSDFRIKEKINSSFKSRLSNNEETLSVLNFFEEQKHSYSIGEINIYGDNSVNRKSVVGYYKLEGDYLIYNWNHDEFSDLSYPIKIDPTVTSNGTLPQASIIGSGLNNAGAFTNGCLYNLSVATPANVQITDVDWTFSYVANGVPKSEGAVRFNYGGCVSPSAAGFFWFCNDLAPGQCNGANISIFSDFESCVPAPQCLPYDMDFTMEFFDAFSGATCDPTFIAAASDWTMTITGETVDEPTPPSSSNGTSICPGASTTLNANGTFGVPSYSYSWAPATNLNDPNIQSPVFTAPGAASSTNYVCTITDICGNTSSNNITITVVDGPNAGSNGTLSICESDPTVDLTLSLGGSPDGGGTWAPALSAGGNTFDPSLDGGGTYTYTVADSPGPPNCPDHSADVVVTFTSGATPTFDPIADVCQNDPNPTLETTSLNGINGTWAPAVSTATLGTTTYTFTPNAGQCATTTTLDIFVTTPVLPTFDPIADVCQNDPNPTLETTSLNGINGTWAPAISTATLGTTTYTFTPNAGQCATTTTLDIFVTTPVLPTFDPIADVCQNDPNPTLETTSLNGINGTWAPAISTATLGTTTYTFTPNAGQCATTTTLDIFVTTPVLPTFDPIADVCQNDPNPTLETTSLNGINGTWAPAISTATLGTTTYIFTPAAGQCATTTTLDIFVTTPVLPTFDPIADVCQNDPNPTLETTSLNGINGTWAPAISTATLGTTTYTFTPTAGQCATTTTLDIFVTTQVLPNFDPITPVCQNDANPTLETTSLNGINGTWAPAISTATLGTTTYTFTPNAGQCATTTTLDVLVTTPISPTFDPIADVCQNDPNPTLETTSLNGFTGTWAPAISTATLGTTTYTFTPNAGQCATTTTLDIFVTTPVLPTFDPIADVCQNDPNPTLETTSLNGINGTWAPAISTATLGTTTYTFTPAAGQCATTTTLDIFVTTPVLPSLRPYC